MKILVSIVAEIDVVSYPLDDLADLLYGLIDDIQQTQKLHGENLPLPLTRIEKSEYGKLTANIARAEE